MVIYDDVKIKEILINFGFNYSLIGTRYLQDALQLVLEKPKSLFSLNTIVLNKIARKNDSTIKNVDSDIKWTINNAYNKGSLKEFYCFGNGKIPTTKQMIIYLFDFIVD